MNNQLSVIPTNQLHLVCGGLNCTTVVAIGGTILGILELPHIFMGIREFTNYVGDRINKGTEVEPGDYFTQFLVNIYNSVAGK